MKKFLLLLTLFLLMLSVLAQDINQGQWLYYSFNGNANNAVTSGLNDGTVVGAALVEGYDGTANGAYAFDGVNDQIFFGDIDLTTESFSVSFWIKLPETAIGNTSYRIMAQRATCSVTNFFDIAYSNTATYGYNIGIEMMGGAANVTGHVNTGPLDNPQSWNHISFVKDNDTRSSKVYVNGILKNNVNWTIPSGQNFPLTSTAQFGVSVSPCINNNNVRHFNGSLDDLRLHRRALAAVDIQSILPFAIMGSSPALGAVRASVSGGVRLDFSQPLDEASFSANTISVNGAVSGVLSPTISVAGERTVFLEFVDGMPAGEEITVTLTNVASTSGESLSSTISFTTATEEESLLAYYPFDGAVGDSSIYGNHLQLNGTAAYTRSARNERGKAFSFGAANYLFSGQVGYSNLGFGKNQDFTVGFWMKASPASAVRPIIYQTATATATYRVQLLSTGQLAFVLSENGVTEQVVTQDRYDNGLWQHVTITADRNQEYRIYVNGILKASQAVNHPFNFLNQEPLYLNYTGNFDNRYGGALDDLKFLNKCLTPAEVKELADLPVRIWPMDGDVAVRPDAVFTIDVAQNIVTESVSSSNFTLAGAVSGSKSVTVSTNARTIQVTPTAPFQLDEEVTFTISGVELENGDVLSRTLHYETGDVNKGMLFYYPFDGDANNAVADTLNGAVNGAILADGFDGTANSAYQFDGNDHIDVAALGLDEESFALAFWMKRNDTKARLEIAGQRNTCNQSNFVEISSPYNPFNGKYEVTITAAAVVNSFDAQSARAEIEPNVWTHITVERDVQQGMLRIYKNGQLADQRAFSGQYSIFNPRVFALGTGNACVNVDGRQAYNGLLDEVRFYRRSLSAQEIEKLVDFQVDAFFPAPGSEEASVTSSIILDVNEDIDQANLATAQIQVMANGILFSNYTVVANGDSLLLKPTGTWPEGQTLEVTVTHLPSVMGNTLDASLSFATASTAEGLVLHLPFDGSLADNSRFNRTIAAYTTVGYRDDRFRYASKALGFNNARNSLQIANASQDLSALNFGVHTDFTISLWFNTGVSGRSQVIYNRATANDKVQVVMLPWGQIQLELNDANTVQFVATAGSRLDDSKWHHIAFSVDRDGQINAYVDGKQSASAAAGTLNANVLADVTIGGVFSGLDQDYFRGGLDDFRIYNRAFTLQEMEEVAPFYILEQPYNGYDAISLNQNFTLEFLRAVSTETAVSENFTVTGSISGSHSVVVTGAGTRNLLINPSTDFVLDEKVTFIFSGLQDTDGNPIPDRTYHYETFNINKGMLVYYPFLGNAENQASDNYNGTVSGAALIADRNDSSSSAYSFDGDDYIDIGNLPLATQSFSISFWMKRDPVQQVQFVAGQRAACTGNNQVNVVSSYAPNDDAYYIAFALGTTALGAYQSVGVSTPIETDTWTHVSVVRDNEAGLLKLYLNGNLEAVQSFNAAYDVSNAASFGISSGSGCINVDVTRRFTGDIDEFRVYNRAITADEAAQLPELVIHPPVTLKTLENRTLTEDEGPVALYKLDTVFASESELDFTVRSSNEHVQAYLVSDTLMVRAEDDYFGTAEIAVKAFTGIGSEQVFTVEITPVNDTPAFTLSNDSLVLTENFAQDVIVALTDLSPANEADQTITYSIDPVSVAFATIDFNTATGQLTMSAVTDGLGSQTFTITADDGEPENNNFSATFQLSVVDNMPPVVVEAIDDLTLDEDASAIALIDVQAVFNDPNGDALTFTVTSDTSGVVPAINGSELVVTLQPNFHGSATVTLTATDSEMSASATFQITVTPVNDAPVVNNPSGNFNATEDEPFAVLLPADQFVDVDGDDLTVQEVIFTGQNGTVGSWLTYNVETRELTGTPAQANVGVTVVAITVTDGELTATDEFEVVVANVNDAPVVVGQVVLTFEEDAPAQAVNLENLFADDDGDELTYSVALVEELEIVSILLLENILTVTPLANVHGQQTVRITASDALESVYYHLAVTITAVNDAPELSNPQPDQQATENTFFTVTLPVDQFTDVDGDEVSIAEVTFTGLNGTEGAWLTWDGASRVISGTPGQANVGVTSVTITATDGLAQTTDEFLITVADVNSAPVVVQVPELIFAEDGPAQTVDLTTVFADADGDALTFAVAAQKGEQPSLIEIALEGALLTIAPLPNMFGVQNLTIVASDASTNVSAMFTITITSVNDAPALAIAIPDQLAVQDQPYAFTLAANTFTDVDGDEITLTVTELPAWLTYEAATTTFSGTPTNAHVGTSVIQVSASDGLLATSTQFSLVVQNVNDAPTVISAPSLSFLEDGLAQTVDLSTLFEDIDGDVLTYSAGNSFNETLAVSLTLVGSVLTVAPLADRNGSFTIPVRATDGEFTATYQLPIEIQAVNDAPAFELSSSELSMNQNFNGSQIVTILPASVPDDEQDQEVIYTISPTDGALVHFSIAGNTIQITSVDGASGTSTFRVEANDGQDANATYEQMLTITVVPILGAAGQAILLVYPNPATDRIVVKSSEALMLELWDASGNLIRKGNSNQVMDVHSLPAGLYFMQCTNAGGQTWVERIMKQ